MFGKFRIFYSVGFWSIIYQNLKSFNQLRALNPIPAFLDSVNLLFHAVSCYENKKSFWILRSFYMESFGIHFRYRGYKIISIFYPSVKKYRMVILILRSEFCNAAARGGFMSGYLSIWAAASRAMRYPKTPNPQIRPATISAIIDFWRKDSLL